MSALNYLNDNFVGQHKIKAELAILMNRLVVDDKISFVFTGPSGYGKTRLSHLLFNYVQTQRRLEYHYYLAPTFSIYRYPHHYIIDEAHLLENTEVLYPILDSGDYSIIFATNLYDLPEALINRCINFNLGKYLDSEIEEIIKIFFLKKNIVLSNDYLETIRQISRGNPRICLSISRRLYYIFQEYGFPESIDILEDIIENLLQITLDGYTDMDFLYLNFLRKVGGRAGLKIISENIKIPIKTIQRDIEPFLIEKEKIQITSRGRIIL